MSTLLYFLVIFLDLFLFFLHIMFFITYINLLFYRNIMLYFIDSLNHSYLGLFFFANLPVHIPNRLSPCMRNQEKLF